MASYVVMEPPGDAGEEEAVLVRDGFHLLAFILPAVWLLVHRLWLETLAVFVVGAAIGLLGSYGGIGPVASVLSLLLALFVGLEGASLKLAALRRRGWREWGVVEADNPRDAEIRYLAEAAGDRPARQSPPATEAALPHTGRREVRPAGPALGMLGYPGRG